MGEDGTGRGKNEVYGGVRVPRKVESVERWVGRVAAASCCGWLDVKLDTVAWRARAVCGDSRVSNH